MLWDKGGGLQEGKTIAQLIKPGNDDRWEFSRF